MFKSLVLALGVLLVVLIYSCHGHGGGHGGYDHRRGWDHDWYGRHRGGMGTRSGRCPGCGQWGMMGRHGWMHDDYRYVQGESAGRDGSRGLCGDQEFDPQTQICCGGRALSLTDNTFCCGGQSGDANSESCCGGQKFRLDGNRDCCHGILYDTTKDVCFRGYIQPKPSPSMKVVQ